MSQVLVSIRKLTLEAATARGTARILRGIDLDIGRRRIVGVVGESGSGKSSLAACLVGLLPANRSRIDGEIVFDGIDLLALPEAAMDAWRGTRIAMIFQDPMTALNPLFTIGTHLVDVLRRRHPGLTRKAAKERSIAALESVGITDSATRSAPTRFTPARIASSGERAASGAPSSSTRPAASNRSPKRARPTCSWPAPRRPTSPTISPP